MAPRYICCDLIDSLHSKQAIQALINGLKLSRCEVIAQYPNSPSPHFQATDILIIWGGGYHTKRSRQIVKAAKAAQVTLVTLDHSWFDTVRGAQYSLSVDTPYPPIPLNMDGYPLDRWQAFNLTLHKPKPRKTYAFTPQVMQIDPTEPVLEHFGFSVMEWNEIAYNMFEHYAPKDVPLYKRERDAKATLTEDLQNATLGLITFNSRAAIEALRLGLWVWSHPTASIWPHWRDAHGGDIRSRELLFAYLAYQQGSLEEFASEGFVSQLIGQQMNLLKYNATAELVA